MVVHFRDEEDRWQKDKAALVGRYMHAFQFSEAAEERGRTYTRADSRVESSGIG